MPGRTGEFLGVSSSAGRALGLSTCSLWQAQAAETAMMPSIAVFSEVGSLDIS